MTAAFTVAGALLAAAAVMLAVTQVRRDLRRTGGWQGLCAEWKRIAFPPPGPAVTTEIPGQRGWTRAQWRDPAYKPHPVTGEPVYTGAKTGAGEWYVRDNGLPAAMRDVERREAS